MIKKLSRKAFSLVELLIVVAVIAITVGIAIPAINNARTDSERASAEARAKLLNDARDRAILEEIDGIKTREEWDARFGTGDEGLQNAAEFILSRNLITLPN